MVNLLHAQESIDMKLLGFGVMVEDSYNDHCLVAYCDDIPHEGMRYNDVSDYSNLMHDTCIVTAFIQQLPYS